MLTPRRVGSIRPSVDFEMMSNGVEAIAETNRHVNIVDDVNHAIVSPSPTELWRMQIG